MSGRMLCALTLGVSIAVSRPLQVVMAQEIVCPRASGDWLYCESRPGLRQESEPVPTVGTLYYRGEPLPHNIAKEGVRIVTPIGTFRYSEREDPLISSGGWLLKDDNTVALYMEKKQIDLEELKAGFYTCGWKYGTPTDWVSVEVDGNSESLYWTRLYRCYCADPAKLEQLRLE